MNHRILDISDAPARLKVRRSLLVIERNENDTVTVPFADIAVVVVSHPQVSYTQAVLSRLSAEGSIFIACDEHRLPVGMLLPLQGHFIQTERFTAQANASLPTKKRLWQQVVRAKITQQADLLEEIQQSDYGLKKMLSRVKSGDPQNVEAQAARKYWSVLFGSNTFRRDIEAQDQNRLLNYGYAVLRAIVARAICAAGLHPSLGLHHHNRYNSFCLADDLMEPYRPIVDRVVAEFVEEYGFEAEFKSEAKNDLLFSLTGRCLIDGEQRTLFDACSKTASSLTSVFLDEATELELPESLKICLEKN